MVLEVISEYYKLLEEDEHHRYKSWEHCYEYYDANHLRMQEPQILDDACLQLAFYLASWGMLRNSFLLQKDYRVHQYLIQEVVADSHYYHYYEEQKQRVPNKDMYQDIDELIAKVRAAYTQHITKVNGVKQQVEVSDTLASKILLGVYGNVPAYDRYFKEGVRLFGIKSTLSKQSIDSLIDFFYDYQDEFEECRQFDKVTSIAYVPMKWLDMYFWQIGYMLEHSDHHKSLLDHLCQAAERYKKLHLKDYSSSTIVDCVTHDKENNKGVSSTHPRITNQVRA